MRSSTRPQNLTQSIAHDLGIAIVTGKYANRTFPKEVELSAQYGAARTVTREAVKMLTSKGLLSARPRAGTLVMDESHWNLLDPDVLRWLLERKFSLELLIEFTQIRLSVEPGAAALAAQVAGGPERAAITAAIERMIAADRGDDDPLSADIAFHVAVLQASGNRFFVQMREMIETALRFSIRKTNDFKGRLASVADHKAVSDAILAGDIVRAEVKMRELIQGALDLMLKVKADEAARRAKGSA